MWTAAEIAAEDGVTRETILHYARQQGLGDRYAGRAILFSDAEREQILDRNRKPGPKTKKGKDDE